MPRKHPGHRAGRDDFERDGWGRPLVPDPDTGEMVAYSRASSFARPLENRHNLELWLCRQTALGVAARSDLQLSVLAHKENKKVLDDLVKQAQEEAKSSSRATIGTALHALTEAVDRGEQLPEGLSDTYAADLAAYKAATKDLEVVAMEQRVVCDELKVAGTFDRVVRYKGKLVVADIKSGASTDYSGLTFAVQVACYAHGLLFNLDAYERMAWPGGETPRHDHALVIHLPAGEGRCSLKWLDIREGWEAAHMASVVKTLQKKKDWFEEIVSEQVEPPASGDGGSLFDATDTIWQVVNNCQNIDETRAAYSQLVAAGHNKDAVLAACLERNKKFGTAA